MSRIDVLIAELCPNGVPVEHLVDHASYIRGVTYGKNDEEPKGPLRVLRSNNITLSSNTLNFDNVKRVSSTVKVRQNQRLHKDDILISAASGSKAHVGKVAYIFQDLPNTVFGGFMAVLRTKGRLEPRFLFHLMVGRRFSDHLDRTLSTTTINNLNATIVGSFQVPVPPLEVQREIVRVLDQFNQLDAELDAELKAELKHRRQQYSFYRETLYSDADFPTSELASLGTIIRGKRFVKADMIDTGVPCIHYGEIYMKYGTYATKAFSYIDPIQADRLRTAEPGDVIIASAGETVEDIGKAVAWLGDDKVVIHDACYAFRSPLDPKFVAYFLETNLFRNQIRRNISSSKISSISTKDLGRARIPVPPQSVQERIVRILDLLAEKEAELEAGLISELAARREQYEYYRDRLLTFEEAAA